MTGVYTLLVVAVLTAVTWISIALDFKTGIARRWRKAQGRRAYRREMRERERRGIVAGSPEHIAELVAEYVAREEAKA